MKVWKWLRANIVVLIALLALVATGTAYFVSTDQSAADKDQTILIQRSRITTLLKANGKLQAQNSGLTDEYTKLYGQATKSGVQPTTVAPSSLPAAGAAGANGKDGRGIAFTLCTGLGLEVTYTDGTTENAGTCVGQTGATGPTGASGAVGKAGTDGAPGTAGQNGTDGTAGADGQPGATGATGPAGTGVSSVSCVTEDDGTTAFRFTLTDGTTQDVAGSCTPPPSDPATPAP